MAHYSEKCSRYTGLCEDLMKLVKDDTESQSKAKELIARLVNAGVVCCPRPSQSTVRLNIVKWVTEPLGIKRISLKEVVQEGTNNPRTGKPYSYKALDIQVD